MMKLIPLHTRILPFPRSGLARIILALFLAAFAIPSLAAQKSVSETVHDALADLQSGEIEIRKGSAMLLGKYPTQPGVMDALISLMADPEAPVRRAAAVSLVENVARITPEQARRLIPSLLDEDTEVRMSIAAWLPQLVMLTLRDPAFRQPPNLPARDSPVRQVLLEALDDPQHLVREKVMDAIRYLTRGIPGDRLVPLLDDPAPTVRLKAVTLLATYLSPAQFAEQVVKHLPEPDRSIRLASAEAMLRNPTPDHHPLIRIFKEDEDPEVRLLAHTLEFLTTPQAELSSEAETALREDKLETALTQQILFTSRRMSRAKALRVAALLLDSERPATRGTAVGTWLDQQETLVEPARLYPFLNDKAVEVRQQAMRYLARNRNLISKELLAELARNRYLDVRQRAVQYIASLPTGEQSRESMRWLLDPEPSVRTAALRHLGQIRPDNWKPLFQASLRDPSDQVQRTAAMLLLGNFGEEGKELARIHAENNPESPVSAYIQARLRRMEPQPRS